MPDRRDDGSVGDDEILWRRLLPDWVEPDGSGQTRTRSIAFLDRKSGEISVHRSHLTTESFVLRDHPTHGIAALPAHIPRSNGYTVAADPVQGEEGEDDDPSHVVLVPPSDAGSNRIKTLARVLARASTVTRPPVAPSQAANDTDGRDPVSDPR